MLKLGGEVLLMFKKLRERWHEGYRQALEDSQDVAPVQVVGNGVMVTKADDVVRTRSFRNQLDASLMIERRQGKH